MMMPKQVTLLAATAVAALLAAAPAVHAQNVSAPLTVTTFAGTAGTRQATNATGTAARFYGPAGLMFDQSGNLIVADSVNNLFRMVTASAVVTTIAGTPMDASSHPINSGSADGTGPAASFQMGSFQSSGGPYDPPNYANPGAITLGRDSSGNIYFADTNNYTIRKLTPGGVVSTIASQAGQYGTVDGAAADARFLAPAGVAVDSHGNVFVTDSGNDTIRKISAGVVSTFAGSARVFGSNDGTGAAAQFTGPQGIAIDSSDNLYVADSGNDTIRKITPAGVVTTIAGSAGQAGSADGSGTQARFNGPLGIAVDGSGNIYVADTKNNLIRKISAAGTVTTIAGVNGVAGSVDGTGTSAQFNRPVGIAVNSTGVYVSDFNNNTLRLGVPASGAGSLNITETPPATVQVTATTNVTLKVVATGTPSPTYQWSKNGTAIAGATTSTLAFSPVSSSDSGNYTVLITSDLVTFTTAPSQLTVFPLGTTVPVTIVAQPSDRTVTANQSTTFTVEATSSAPLSYQWKKDGVAITGATASSYTISSVQTADAAVYTVTVSDGTNPSSTTGGATLAVTGGTAPVAPIITIQPISQTVVLGGTVTFTAAASGSPTPTYQWQKGGANVANSATISGAATGTLTITGVASADAGTYTLVATNSAGTVTSTGAVLTISGAVAPTITTQPSAVSANAGDTATFSVVASGTPTPTYQWRKGGTNVSNSTTISGATSATLTITGVTATDAGNYTVVVSNSEGNVTSSAAALTVNTPTGPAAWLTNVSVRTTMTAGQNPLIVSMVTNGAKDILVRGVGPGLVSAGVTGVLPDPSLEIHRLSDSALIGANDNWSASLSTTFNAVGAFPLPDQSKDAALVQTVNGANSAFELATGSGIVLVEGYDTQPDSNAIRLVNVSARNFVGTGGNVLIAGFAVRGTGNKRLLIRGVGPELAKIGLPGTLADPKLEIYAGTTLIAQNDDWDSSLTTTFDAVYAFHLTTGSKDAAIVVDLPASPSGITYTAQVKGADGGTGVALVEVYEVP